MALVHAMNRVKKKAIQTKETVFVSITFADGKMFLSESEKMKIIE